MEAIERRVQAAVADEFGVPESVVTPRARLVDDLGADEFAKRELVVRLNDEFGIGISEADIETMSTIGEVVDCVRRRVPQTA
ncbi:acyl carrier protein [Yinghuangia aomiensis]